MQKITSFSVKYPVTVTMLILGTLLLGVISYIKLGVDLFPNLVTPRLYVQVESSELPPDEMERQFIEPLESLIMRQSKVSQVATVCRVGMALITVEYSWNADMDEAYLDLQKNISGYSQNLSGVTIQVSQQDINAEPILLLAFHHPEIKDMDALRKVAVNYVRNELIRLEGIAAVEILGDESREVWVETSPYLLKAHGLTMETVASKIQSYNRNISGGSVTEMGRKYIIKGLSAIASLKDIEEIIVGQETRQTGDVQESIPIYLKDVATISFKNSEPVNIVRMEGERCLGLAIYKESGFNTVKAVEQAQEGLTNIREALPGYLFDEIRNQARFISSAVDEVEQSALIGIVLAVMILFVFLRRMGTTAVISIAIPISVVATFNLMYFNGLTVNIMTLGGLALGAGMLVDNAIVVVENIIRHLEMGDSVKDSAIIGTAEVSGAITASTLTTVIVFLPIIYVRGVAGALFEDQAWTVAFSLLSSLVVAVLVIPMLSARILKKETPQSGAAASVQFPGYKRLLENILEKHRLVLAGGLALMLLGVGLIPYIGSEFLPRAASDQIALRFTMEDGATLEYTDGVAQGLTQIARETLGDDYAYSYVQIGPDNLTTSQTEDAAQGDNEGVVHIFLKENAISRFEAHLTRLRQVLEGNPEMEIQVLQDETALQNVLGLEGAPLSIDIIGEEAEVLYPLAEKALQKLRAMPELDNLESSIDRGRPQVNVTVDRRVAGMYNVNVTDIGNQLENYLTGLEAGDWDNDGELQTIRLKTPEPGINQLKALEISTAQGSRRLDELADIRTSTSPAEILRDRQRRIVRISADRAGNIPLDQAATLIRQKLAEVPFPAGYYVEIGGQEQRRQESFGDLKFALILSILLIYMVLAAQFESLIHPFTILLTIPLAVVGSLITFFMLGMSLNIMAYIGIIMLVGIAVNDSIILVDAINKLREGGMERMEAIVQAGQNRIRPIIMTSLTTILALLPLTLGFGESASLRAPMAIAVIGGLITSTLLTLVVIPCVYLALDHLRPAGR